VVLAKGDIKSVVTGILDRPVLGDGLR